MLLRLHIEGAKRTRMLVPSEAVIRTGQRAVVIVRKEDGAFEPREVTLGAEQGEDIEIAQGLAEGEQVVASGQFLIDSEARLRSVLGSMAGRRAAAAVPRHVAQGKVESVERDGLTISHEPVASLKWPAMTMGFSKPRRMPSLTSRLATRLPSSSRRAAPWAMSCSRCSACSRSRGRRSHDRRPDPLVGG